MTRKTLSQTISRIIPSIASGAHLSFIAEKRVTQCQFQVLMALYTHKQISMNDLATRMHIKMPTATGIVNRIVKSGCAKRVRVNDDRRKVMVELTDKGVHFVHRFQAAIAVRWEEVLGFLDEKDLRDYERIASKIESGFKLQQNKP